MSLSDNIQALTGQAPANPAQHINSSARLLFRIMSAQDAIRLATEQPVDVSTGLAVGVNDIIVGVHNGSRPAAQAPPSDIPALSDATSFLQATALDPKYYFSDGSLYVVPANAGARAYVLSIATIDPATDTVISWLPMELEEAAVLRAAILELQELLNSGLAGLSFDYANFITTYKPSTPIIADSVYTDAAGTLTTKTSQASLAALGAFPTASISADVGTLISDIVAGRADMDAIIARIKLATEDTDTPAPASGNDAYSDVALTYSLDPSGLSAGTSGTDQDFIPLLDAPTAITEEVLTEFDGIITEITNRLASADDVEVAGALTAQARTVVEKYATQVRENVETYRLRMEGFKTELERAIQNAQFGLRDRELDITDKNATIAGIQAETQRKQLELRAEETKIARNRIRSEDRQAEIQGIATNIQSANQTISSLIGQYQTDVQRATAQFQGTLREYDAALQVALAKFQSDVQAELQDAQTASNIAVQNAVQNFQASVQNIQKALAIFSTEAGLYGQDVGLYTQTMNNELQRAQAASERYANRLQALMGMYQEAVQTYISRYAEAPAENN